MAPDVAIFAMQRSASGRWVTLAPSDDPFKPAVVVVDVADEPRLVSRHVFIGKHEPIGKKRPTNYWNFG
jgi:hypothetical protein